MEAKTYTIVGLGNTLTGPLENLVDVMAAHGRKIEGVQAAEYSPGRRFREEIIGQPIFTDMCGPMADRAGVVRYESWKAYAALSS
jgi:hypothetical protein